MASKDQSRKLTTIANRIATLAKSLTIRINLILPNDEDLSKSDYYTPSKPGDLHPTKPYIAVKHPEGQLMWHHNKDLASKTDNIINDPKLRQNFLNKLPSQTHRAGLSAIMDMVAKDPNRHFVPSRDQGREKMRARHIKSLLLNPESAKIDLSPDNKLTISMARHGTLGGHTVWPFSLQPKEVIKHEKTQFERSQQEGNFEITQRVLSGRDLRQYGRGKGSLAKAQDNSEKRDVSNNNNKDMIPGGLADKKKAQDFDPEQLAAGIKVEREHTSSDAIAREIAMDHLTEDKNYYKKLKTIEKSEQPKFKRGDIVHLSHGMIDREKGGEQVDRTKKFTVHGTGTRMGRVAHWVVPVGESDSKKGFFQRQDRMYPIKD